MDRTSNLKWTLTSFVGGLGVAFALAPTLSHYPFALAAASVLASSIASWVGAARAARHFAAVMNTLHEKAQHAQSGISQISGTSSNLANASTKQAAALEESAASLEEIASASAKNAAWAAEANQLAEEMEERCIVGTQAAENMAKAISEMEKASRETEEIIKTIDEIAFQTNLLALNAAVEAARAGDAGKGFAVVAEEVRALAQRSSSAARDTAEKIGRAKKQAACGMAVSSQVGEALQQINERVTKSVGLIKELSAGSAHQARGVTEINQGVAELDRTTQENSASAEELAAATADVKQDLEWLCEHTASLRSLETKSVLAKKAMRTVSEAEVSVVVANPRQTASVETPKKIVEKKAISASPAKAPKQTTVRERSVQLPPVPQKAPSHQAVPQIAAVASAPKTTAARPAEDLDPEAIIPLDDGDYQGF